MDYLYRYAVLLAIVHATMLNVVAQSNQNLITQDTTYTLSDNTLTTNFGVKITVGQKLIIGAAAGKNGWYRSITFRSPTAWPILLLREQELQQNVEYQSDESVRTNDKLKEHLHQGDTLTVTKIKRLGRKVKGDYWYVVMMRREAGSLSLNFTCHLKDAIRFGELIFPAP